MSVALRRGQPMRVAEFIEWAAPRPDEERWELLDGEPVLMAPQSEPHQMIVANLLAALRKPSEREGCRALPGLAVLSESADDFAPIPDVVVRCGALGTSGYVNDPVFLAEILSPSTMDNDRGRKATFYKSVPSLRLFMAVFQDEPRVEIWRRDGDGWAFQARGKKDAIELPRPAFRLPVAKIYAGLPF